jgi:hypothetical protein
MAMYSKMILKSQWLTVTNTQAYHTLFHNKKLFNTDQRSIQRIENTTFHKFKRFHVSSACLPPCLPASMPTCLPDYQAACTALEELLA